MKAGLKQWLCVCAIGAALSLGAGMAGRALAAETPVVPPPTPPPAESEAQRLLDKQSQDDKRLREEISTQAASHVDSAKRLYAAFDYEKAKEELETALRMEPGNEEARKLLASINDILNVRRDRIRSAVAQLYGQYKIQVQEKLMELDNKVDWGRRFLQEAASDPNLSLADRIRRYEQGLAAFEKAKELLKYMPVEVNVDEQTNEVNRLSGETQKAIKLAQVRLEQTDREQAQRLATEQAAAQKRFLERKIATMVDQGKHLFETGKYDAAVDLAKKILELDPINAEAQTIIATARDHYHADRKKYNEEEYKEHFTLNRETRGAHERPPQ